MLKSLSDKQISAMPRYVEKWIKIGLSTDRVDFEKAKGLIAVAYQKVGLPEPKRYHFALGPNEAWEIYRSLGGKNDRSAFLNGNMFGSQDATWLSYYDYYKRETNIKLTDIDYMIDIALNCGWIYCSDEDVIIQDRPIKILFDEQNRLHCQTGPAIQYGDGFEVYSWHGVTVPGKWIRGELTSKEALKVSNLEQRRAACEILGWAKVLKELNSVAIDQDEDPMIGTLLEVDIPNVGKEKFLRVLCGTGREFCLPVPPDMRTALEANAWTYGVDPQKLRDLEVRT
jgi:hypothetical protein